MLHQNEIALRTAIKGKDEETALANIELIQKLSKNPKGPSLSALDAHKKSFLFLAIENELPTVAEILLKHLAENPTIFTLTSEDQTIYSITAKKGYRDIFNELMVRESILLPNSKLWLAADSQGYTPLIYSIIKDKFECVKLLLNKIKNEPDAKEFINHTDDNGNTTLHYAYQNNSMNSVQLLRDFGADFWLKNNNKKIPIALMVRSGDVSPAQKLQFVVNELKKEKLFIGRDLSLDLVEPLYLLALEKTVLLLDVTIEGKPIVDYPKKENAAITKLAQTAISSFQQALVDFVDCDNETRDKILSHCRIKGRDINTNDLDISFIKKILGVYSNLQDLIGVTIDERVSKKEWDIADNFEILQKYQVDDYFRHVPLYGKQILDQTNLKLMSLRLPNEEINKLKKLSENIKKHIPPQLLSNNILNYQLISEDNRTLNDLTLEVQQFSQQLKNGPQHNRMAWIGFNISCVAIFFLAIALCTYSFRLASNSERGTPSRIVGGIGTVISALLVIFMFCILLPKKCTLLSWKPPKWFPRRNLNLLENFQLLSLLSKIEKIIQMLESLEKEFPNLKSNEQQDITDAHHLEHLLDLTQIKTSLEQQRKVSTVTEKLDSAHDILDTMRLSIIKNKQPISMFFKPREIAINIHALNSDEEVTEGLPLLALYSDK